MVPNEIESLIITYLIEKVKGDVECISKMRRERSCRES